MLFFSRRFFPFFITQFFGAFNDNFFKNAMLIYFSTLLSAQVLSFFTNLAMALFILPMFLFSAWSGLVAESIEKRKLILALKLFEVLIIIIGITAFILGNMSMMLAVLFLLGLQSTFFGPVKYGILPERLENRELMAANGYVEAGTFIAILVGTILGAWLSANGFSALEGGSSQIRSFMPLYMTMIIATGLGMIAAYFVPKKIKLNTSNQLPPFHPWRQTLTLLRYTKSQASLFRVILAISWFWVIGAVLLTQIPQLSKEILGAASNVITYLLSLFSIGVALGSLFAAKLTRGRIDPSISSFAALLMFIFLGVIAHLSGYQTINTEQNLREFIQHGPFIETTIGFLGTAIAGGLYVVPLYAKLQHDSVEGHKSQIIAANNIINSFFMVVVSLLSLLILSALGLSMQSLLLGLTIVHALIALWLCHTMPDYILRLVAIGISRILYRLKIQGIAHIPSKGAALIVCNHMTYLDAVILLSASPRPLRFVIYYKIYRFWPLTWLFNYAKTIPIAGSREDAKIFRQSFEDIHQHLQNGEVVLIFPEGKITPDGTLQPFQRGVEYILERDPVPVIPARLDNLWGSYFSHYRGLFKGRKKRFRAKIVLHFGPALPAHLKAHELQNIICEIEPIISPPATQVQDK